MKDKKDEELYFEPLFSYIDKAERDVNYILNEYYHVRLYNLYKAIKEKIKEAEKVSSEKSEKLKESVISKLEELIKLTRPNIVDNKILEVTSYYINNIKPEDPEPAYVNNLKKLSKGLDILLKDAHYYLQKIYLQIIHGKLTPESFYPFFEKMRDFAYKIDPNPDEKDIEFIVRKAIAEECIRKTVYDLFENPDKHQQLIKEGRYTEETLNRFCSKYQESRPLFYYLFNY